MPSCYNNFHLEQRLGLTGTPRGGARDPPIAIREGQSPEHSGHHDLFFSLTIKGQLTEIWKQKNDRGNRYEGRIDIPVSKPDLEVLSFIGYKESLAGYPDLKVRFYLPINCPVAIKGMELQEDKQY